MSFGNDVARVPLTISFPPSQLKASDETLLTISSIDYAYPFGSTIGSEIEINGRLIDVQLEVMHLELFPPSGSPASFQFLKEHLSLGYLQPGEYDLSVILKY